MRPARVAALLPCLAPALAAGCHRGDKQSPPSSRGTSSAVGVASSAVNEVGFRPDAPVFSAPIAATRVGRMDVVAGLVVAEAAVRVMGLGATGMAWTVEVLRGVAWAPDAELRLQAVTDGVALFWRGPRDGKPVRTLVRIGPYGEPRGEPTEIGATFCSTADGVVWIGSHATGLTRVKARQWSEPEARDLIAMPPDRDPALVCGEHDVVVLGEGDDDLTASTFAPGETVGKAPIVALRDTDFADEQREHHAYTIGDDFALVRIGTSGSIAIREVPHGGNAQQWRRLKHRLSAADDVVAVDGDAVATLIIVTHDADTACAAVGSMPETLQAIRIDRKTGEESLIDLAPADCDRTRGPFWIEAAPAAQIVAWVERRTLLPPKVAPITGVAFRVLRVDGIQVGTIEQQADAVAAGGCDERGCAVAALVRELGSDGMRPAPIRVFGYP